MTQDDHLIERDKRHVFHPCTQMKTLETCAPFIVNLAKGSYLYTNQGPLIDAISSWWCKSLGHGHPGVLAAIQEQLAHFEHVITANTTWPALVKLAEKLAKITGKQHVFFASDGATAVEIAMKLALQAQQIKGHPQKREFIALKNAYHGESLATLGISDLGLYKKPFESLGPVCHFIEPPYVSTTEEICHQPCLQWSHLETRLNALSDKVCAVVVEPLIQGAAGMLCYQADFLRKLANWAKENDIYLIADEIMTGIGKTGHWLASQLADIEPDLICLSKGLTSGALPMSCVMLDHAVFDLFYAEPAAGKSFLHSNTFSGNPLAVSAALATLTIMETENILQGIPVLEKRMRAHFETIAQNTGVLTNIRGTGAIIAADLVGDAEFGNRIYQSALQKGAFIRPIGKTIYWLPPLNIESSVLDKLADITEQAICAAQEDSLQA